MLLLQASWFLLLNLPLLLPAAAYGFVQEKDGDPTAQLLAYCDEMASTAAWGGQMELGALAEVRGPALCWAKKHTAHAVMVHS